MEKKNFMIYKDQRPLVDKLSDEQAGKLFKGIFQYTCGDGIPTNLDDMTDLVFTSFQTTLHRDLIKYRETCKKRSEAVSGRWKNTNEYKSTEVNTNEYNSIQMNTKDTDRERDRDRDRDRDIYTDDDYIYKRIATNIQRYVEVKIIDIDIVNKELPKFTKTLKVLNREYIVDEMLSKISDEELFNLFYQYLCIYQKTNLKEDYIDCSNKGGYFRRIVENKMGELNDEK